MDQGRPNSIILLRKTLWIGVLAVCLPTSIRAGSLDAVGYPEPNPAFTLTVPEGWQSKREQGALKLIAEADAVVLVQRVDNVKDEAGAKQALPELVELEGKQFNMNGVVIGTTPSSTTMGDFSGFATVGYGTDPGGHKTSWQSLIFSPREGEYYLVTALWTAADAEKTAADRTAIFSSLRTTGLR